MIIFLMKEFFYPPATGGMKTTSSPSLRMWSQDENSSLMASIRFFCLWGNW